MRIVLALDGFRSSVHAGNSWPGSSSGVRYSMAGSAAGVPGDRDDRANVRRQDSAQK